MASQTMHVAIVLDRSGSMETCRQATIDGFNEYLGGLRETAQHEEVEVRVTLTVFNGEVVVPLSAAPLSKLHTLSHKTYVPGGTTAMLDAVGETLDRLERDSAGSYLVCVISD